MDYGYSRCSTNETRQDINRQVRELKAAGAVEIFMEYEHGDAKVKSQQAQMFAQVQPGDTIIVLEVSRLARSTQQLCEIIEIVRQKHLRLVIVGSITLDCRNGQADRSIFTDGGRIQSVGTGYDPLPCAVWHGKRQSQGEADWAAADHRG